MTEEFKKEVEAQEELKATQINRLDKLYTVTCRSCSKYVNLLSLFISVSPKPIANLESNLQECLCENCKTL